MASISGLCSSSSTFKHGKFSLKTAVASPFGRELTTFPNRSKLLKQCWDMAAKSVARDISASVSKMSAGLAKGKVALEKDPGELWRRYVQWLYQHKELGLYLDVSRMGFTDEFVEDMELKLQAAFRAMEELDKAAIANPDEGRMVGHYWLRNPKLAPNEFLRLQIENTLEAVCKFAEDVVGGKVGFCSIYHLLFKGY